MIGKKGPAGETWFPPAIENIVKAVQQAAETMREDS
jgi:hypothetical protein